MEIIDLLTRLLVALFLGFVIGTERVFAGKTAGPRTYALVAMGSAIFVIISQVVSQQYLGMTNFDPLRMASQIIVGIGFLGAGMIILSQGHLVGLTTASGIWVAAGIGMAAGFGLFLLAVVSTILVLFIFSGLWFLERKLKIWHDKKASEG